MNVFVLAGQTSIVISGSDPIQNDTVQVVIKKAIDDSIVYNVSYTPAPKPQNFPVDPNTYNVSVYWNTGQNASIFNGVVVPPSGGNLPDPHTDEGKAVEKSGAPPAAKYLRHDASKTYEPPEKPPKPPPQPHPHHLAH
jgi:hypothetical protein